MGISSTYLRPTLSRHCSSLLIPHQFLSYSLICSLRVNTTNDRNCVNCNTSRYLCRLANTVTAYYHTNTYIHLTIRGAESKIITIRTMAWEIGADSYDFEWSSKSTQSSLSAIIREAVEQNGRLGKFATLPFTCCQHQVLEHFHSYSHWFSFCALSFFPSCRCFDLNNYFR